MKVLLWCTAVALAAGPGFAQPKAVELYLTGGFLKGGGDESSVGSAPCWGGALTVPLTRRLAVDIGAQNARIARERPPSTYYRVRRWVVSPALLYRFGNARVYGFVGGGVGAEVNRSVTIEGNFLPDYRPVGWEEIGPGVWKTSNASRRNTFHVRGGFVAAPARHWVVRVDLDAAWAYVLPNVGVKVGLGYRF